MLTALVYACACVMLFYYTCIHLPARTYTSCLRTHSDESKAHGWPSFRDEEVVWENIRFLEDGEAVSIDGTHIGHNLPDRKGNR